MANPHRFCGPGSITLDLARRVGPEGSVVGIDAAAPAVDAARAAARERGDVRTRLVGPDVADGLAVEVHVDLGRVRRVHVEGPAGDADPTVARPFFSAKEAASSACPT